MSEWHLDLGSINSEDGRIIGWGENPVISLCTGLEILDTDTGCINSYGLWKWFYEGFEESIKFFGLVCKEVFLEIFDEAGIYLGLMFFHSDFLDIIDF